YFSSLPNGSMAPYSRRDHPPHTVRVRCAMEWLRMWARQNNRERLHEHLQSMFHEIHREIILHVTPEDQRDDWLREVSHMLSDEGRAFNERLNLAIDVVRGRTSAAD